MLVVSCGFDLIIFADPPVVHLRLGRTLDPLSIQSGHDVYFECDVRANPPHLRLEWLHNVSRFPTGIDYLGSTFCVTFPP
jgi:hypothetical protein